MTDNIIINFIFKDSYQFLNEECHGTDIFDDLTPVIKDLFKNNLNNKNKPLYTGYNYSSNTIKDINNNCKKPYHIKRFDKIEKLNNIDINYPIYIMLVEMEKHIPA